MYDDDYHSTLMLQKSCAFLFCYLLLGLLIVQVIAIGPTTAAEMTRTLGRVDGTAALPDPQHVCHTVKSLCSQSGT